MRQDTDLYRSGKLISVKIRALMLILIPIGHDRSTDTNIDFYVSLWSPPVSPVINTPSSADNMRGTISFWRDITRREEERDRAGRGKERESENEERENERLRHGGGREMERGSMNGQPRKEQFPLSFPLSLSVFPREQPVLTRHCLF